MVKYWYSISVQIEFRSEIIDRDETDSFYCFVHMYNTGFLYEINTEVSHYDINQQLITFCNAG